MSEFGDWPPELLARVIKAMAPERVCRMCGKPRRRITAQLNEERERIGKLIAERRVALGLKRRDLVPLFIDHYKNAESVLAQISGWELAKWTPMPLDWSLLRTRLGIETDEFDSLIEAESRWNDATYEYVNNDLGGLHQDASGKLYRRLTSRQNRIPPERFSDCGHDSWRSGAVLDPFGIGVTAEVASALGRDGIEIQARAVLDALRDAMPDGDT